jgi:hypothetical protein
MDETRGRAKRFKPTLKKSTPAKTAIPPKTATPLSGVCSPDGAAVELDGNVPVRIRLRLHEKVQRAGGNFLLLEPAGGGRFRGGCRPLNGMRERRGRSIARCRALVPLVRCRDGGKEPGSPQPSIISCVNPALFDGGGTYEKNIGSFGDGGRAWFNRGGCAG